MCLLLFSKAQRRKKGLFSDFKEDILSTNFQQHIQTNTQRNTYMNMYV